MVKAVVGQFDCVLLVGLYPPQIVVPVAMYQHGIYHGDVKTGIVKEAGNRQMVVPCSLHHYAGFALQAP